MANRESELKFTCANYYAPRIQQGVESVCFADKSFQENIINSVYFDTPDWQFAMEKASSDFLKAKIRLRWYYSASDQSDAYSPCFLEFKRKVGSKREKTRLEMPFNSSNVLNEITKKENIELFDSYIREHAPEMSNKQVEPKFVVQYRRSRYVEKYSNTRISFDRDIRAFSVDNNGLFVSSSINLPETVLEVKGECDDLPEALRMQNLSVLKKAAFSKYYECFKLLSGYEQ